MARTYLKIGTWRVIKSLIRHHAEVAVFLHARDGHFAGGMNMNAKEYVVPAGHEKFVEEFKALLKKFPDSASRFKLADMGDEPPMAFDPPEWKCDDWGEFGIHCRPVIK